MNKNRLNNVHLNQFLRTGKDINNVKWLVLIVQEKEHNI